MKTSSPMCLFLCVLILVVGCATSDPVVNDYKMIQSVYKQQALKDQQTISDLRRNLDVVQRELKAAEGTRTASEGKLSEALRQVEQQRDELTRAKDERSQLTSQQTTQMAPIIRQLTEELARAREERAQFAQTTRQFTQHMLELERLKQTLAEAGRDPRLQSIETAITKQNDALTALQENVQGVRQSLTEVQRQAQQKAQPQASATPSSGKRKTTNVPKDIPATPTDTLSAVPKDNLPPAPKETLSATATRTVIVKAGDTLKSIGQKHGVSAAQLKELNRLDTDELKVGQSLMVPSVKKPNNP
jgi:LysM repeat protein